MSCRKLRAEAKGKYALKSGGLKVLTDRPLGSTITLPQTRCLAAEAPGRIKRAARRMRFDESPKTLSPTLPTFA
jgi:hypothetical protein